MALFPVTLGLPVVAAAGEGGPGEGAKEARGPFIMQAIGRVEKTGDRTEIVLDKAYAPGLMGLGQFPHVWVFWWFDRNDTPEKRSILQVHPQGNPDNPLRGVFATRSPVRPNLIALSLCKVTAVRGHVVEVEAIDAFAGTPVLDLKPYSPGSDAVHAAGTAGPPAAGAGGADRTGATP